MKTIIISENLKADDKDYQNSIEVDGYVLDIYKNGIMVFKEGKTLLDTTK